ncbi:MAG: DnaJ domain-containing protein [Clostridia bacterium]|nr:DnaJ domain-containing protein [Clostridia bacterium]
MINYYKELGISRYANLQQIKSAYVKQLKKYHPDIYKGDENFAQEKTAILNDGYNTLKDQKLRLEYDRKLFGNPVCEKQTLTYTASSNKKPKRENIFKEFTKYFKINLKTEKNSNQYKINQTNSKSKKSKNNRTKTNKSQKIKSQTISKFITNDDINKKEKSEGARLSKAIIVVILLIIVTMAIILFV